MCLLNGFFVSDLTIKTYNTRRDMGVNAAIDVARRLRQVIQEKGEANMIFAAAPSQNEFLNGLTAIDGIAWDKVNAFHMDEYIGLPMDAPQAFGQFLKDRIFGLRKFKSVNYLNGNAGNLDEECLRYEALLRAHRPDIVCMGIGENGHIAFNDPWVADFRDKKWVKVVELDEICRNQQVNDGCFAAVSEVPTHAITLTVPALTAADSIFCVVPSRTKAPAVRNTLYGEVSESCPASILRRHKDAVLYCDSDSAELLQS